jgi:hypothetical protein
MKEPSKKGRLLLVLTIILAITTLTFYLQKLGLKQSINFRYEAVPHIDLGDSMSFDKTGKATGKISGFVAFKNSEDQPKRDRQYYVIEALDLYDENSRQLFVYDDIIKLDYLPPTSIGKTILSVISNSQNNLTLQDEYGNLFRIDMSTKAVSMSDSTNDSVYLITSDSAYGDFILDFLKR